MTCFEVVEIVFVEKMMELLGARSTKPAQISRRDEVLIHASVALTIKFLTGRIGL
jgi:hypothetical protein